MGRTEDVERNGYSMFADATTIQGIFTTTGCECFGQSNAVLFPVAVLHQSTNLTVRLPSKGDGEAAIGETADGTLEAVRGDLLQDRQHQR
jgi:hypothetical protein